MIKKKRRLVTWAAIAVIVIVAVHQFTKPPIIYKVDSQLIEINNILRELSQDPGFKHLTISSSRTTTTPNDIGESIPPDIYAFIEDTNIKRISFYNDSIGKTSVFGIDQFFTFFRPRWYYRFSDNELIDEDIVPSLEEAVEQQNGPPYFLCQRAEMPNWFYCTAYDP